MRCSRRGAGWRQIAETGSAAERTDDQPTTYTHGQFRYAKFNINRISSINVRPTLNKTKFSSAFSPQFSRVLFALSAYYAASVKTVESLECPSVCPSVCLSRRSTAAAAANGFAAEVGRGQQCCILQANCAAVCSQLSTSMSIKNF